MTPEPGEEDVHIGLMLRYEYTNTVIATNPAGAYLYEYELTGKKLRSFWLNNIPVNLFFRSGSGTSSGPMSLGPSVLSGPTSIGSGPTSGPNSMIGATSLGSLGPTAEFRTVILNVPVVLKVGKVETDPSESHA